MAAALVLRCGGRPTLALSLGRRQLFLRTRNYSAMSGLLIEEPKYSFLKDLGLGADNVGAYYGEWNATGEVSKNPPPKLKCPLPRHSFPQSQRLYYIRVSVNRACRCAWLLFNCKSKIRISACALPAPRLEQKC